MKHLKTFESYIENRRYRYEISKDKFKELLHNQCSQFLEVIRNFSNAREVKRGKNNFIFRKFPENLGKFIFTNPKDSNIERVAPWSEFGNWHNLITSNLECWSNYPRRNKSLIGASHGRAFTHVGSDDYLIIPYDATKIGLCPKPDFWNSFKTFNSQNLDFSRWVSLLIKKVAQLNNIELTNDKDYASILPYLDKIYNVEDLYRIDSYVAPSTSNPHLYRSREPEKVNFFRVLGGRIEYDSEKTLLENLNHFLSPDYNNFTLDTFTGVSGKVSGVRNRDNAKECWFEDEGLLIDWNYLTQIMSDEDFSDIFLVD